MDYTSIGRLYTCSLMNTSASYSPKSALKQFHVIVLQRLRVLLQRRNQDPHRVHLLAHFLKELRPVVRQPPAIRSLLVVLFLRQIPLPHFLCHI